MSVFLVAKGGVNYEKVGTLSFSARLQFRLFFAPSRDSGDLTYLLLKNLIKGATYAPIQVFQALRAGVNKSWTSEK